MQTKTVTILGMCISFLLISIVDTYSAYPLINEFQLVSEAEIKTPVFDSVAPIPYIKNNGSVKKRKKGKFDSGIAKTRRNSLTDAECLTMVIYHEARDQSYKGKAAVADVTLNRIKHSEYPDSVCSVVTQPNQYSGFHRIKKPSSDRPDDLAAWDESKHIATRALKEGNKILHEDVLYFHSVKAKPAWRHKMRRIARIDDHIFYAKRKAVM